jgi:hypothetical protein
VEPKKKFKRTKSSDKLSSGKKKKKDPIHI